MRVAYICADPGVPVFGRKGCSVHVQEVIRALVARGAAGELFAARTGGEAPAVLASVVVRPLPCPDKGKAGERERAQVAANEALAEALEGGAFDLVYERYSLWSYAAVEWARRRGVPCVVEVNAPLIEEQAAHRTLVDREGAVEVARRALGTATAVVCVSREVAAYVRSLGVAERNVHVVPNGVDPARFAGAAERVSSGRAFTVGFVGTLKPWHGVETLVDAFALLRRAAPEARLLIVGDGPERGRMVGRATCLGVEGVVDWTGAVGPEQVPELLGRMDVAVAPYPEMERFYFSPLKLYEYMAAGLAVVASRVGQVAEVVRDGETGVLVPPGDAVALAEVLGRLQEDPRLRARLGEAARAEVVANHTWGRVVERVLEIAGVERPVREAATV